jgi:hypothetical protein
MKGSRGRKGQDSLWKMSGGVGKLARWRLLPRRSARCPLASSHRLSELVSHNNSLLQSVFDFYVLILNREPVVVMRAV